jgi:zinc protease
MTPDLVASPAATDRRTTRIQRVVTPRGIEAWLVHEPAVPVIALDFAVAGGSAQDPVGRAGLGAMAAGLLDEGAGDLDARAFQDRLEETAVELHFEANRDHLRGSLRSLSAEREAAFDLLRLAITEPRYDDEPVERLRAQTLSSLKRASTDPNDLASRLWWSTAFPGHPYGRPGRGIMADVEAIRRDELAAAARAMLARDTLKIAVVGDIDAATLAPMLDRVFGDLPATAPLGGVAEAAPQGLGRLGLVDIDVPQTVLVFGGRGIKRDDPDFMAAMIANHILGGGVFSSRLFREVREKRGLTYGVSTSLAALDRTALMLGGSSTRNERVPEMLDVLRSEIAGLGGSGPTDDELKRAKSYLTGSYALRFDTSGKIAGQLVQLQLDGLPIDYIDRRNALVDAVSMDEVRRACARICGDGGLLIAMAGRPQGVTADFTG